MGLEAEGVRSLSVEGMDPDRGCCEWVASMIVKNAKTLDHLSLGFHPDIAYDFALNNDPRHHEMTSSLATAVKKALFEYDQEPRISLLLDSLYLCGPDLGSVVRGEMALDIDFTNMTELRLESCPRLSQAFSLFMGQGGSTKLALGALDDLFVRLEDPDPNFSANFESFLTSLPRLSHLCVLIDNCLAVQNLEPILQVHGGRLCTLLWDERSGPRINLKVPTSNLSTRVGNLRVVAKYCPYLKVLGLPLDWEAISSSDKYHEAVIPPPTFTRTFAQMLTFS